MNIKFGKYRQHANKLPTATFHLINYFKSGNKI